MTFLALLEKMGGVLFMPALSLAGVKVKNWLLGKSLPSSLQLVRIQ